MVLRVTLAFLAALAVATPAAAKMDMSLDRVVSARQLTVGVSLNAPWVIKRPDGSLAGYDIDLVNALAKDLGATPHYVELPFAELLPRLGHGDIDMVASGLAITPARSRVAVFTNPTGLSLVRTVARFADGKGGKAVALGAGAKIAVLGGSTDEAAAKASYRAATVVAYPTYAAALGALINGQAQAMVATSPVPRMAVRLYDAQLGLAGKPLTRTAEAFALRPDDDRLRLYLNNWIDARKADGFLENARQHWFFSFGWMSDLEPRKSN